MRSRSLLQEVASSGKQGEEDSTIKTASAVSQRIFHHALTPQEKQFAGRAVHYAFGTTVEAEAFLRIGWGSKKLIFRGVDTKNTGHV
jgi:hypothetical protein